MFYTNKLLGQELIQVKLFWEGMKGVEAGQHIWFYSYPVHYFTQVRTPEVFE